MYIQDGFAGGHIWCTAPSGTAGNAITFTQAMTLDASGNLLVGTTTANANFYVYNAPVSYAGLNATAIFSSSASQSTGTGGLIAFEGKYTSGGAIANFAAIGGLKENSTDNNYSGYLGFYTRSNGSLAAERARIDSDGRLLVGLTSFVATGYRLQIANGTGGGIVSTADNVGDANYWSRSDNIGYHFYASTVAGAGRFAVATNGNVTNANNSYGGISDVKLKENIIDATPKLEKLGQVRVVNFNFIGDQQKQIGVIAQELEQIFPSMIDESSDRDAEGNDLGTKTKSVKYSVFVPMLIKAIQEQQAIITQLTARITALEGA
jgi:hypothetical protein